MTGILGTLRTIVAGENAYAWLDENLRKRVESALIRKGMSAC